MKTKTSALTALTLLAVATIMPACELTRECDPRVEYCEFTGNHPDTLDEHPMISGRSSNR